VSQQPISPMKDWRAEPDDIRASVVIHWPVKPTVVDPRAFSAAADVAVKTLAAAVVKLAQLRRG
jgi:hypothetical protein